VVTYLVAIAVTNYVEFTDYAHFDGRSDSLPVLNYVFPQFEASSRSEVKDILPMLRLMDSLFIPYPFEKEKYGHAQFTWGGGMEHQTMSFMVNFSFDLMAHEVAHQWFGDMVTCGSWNDLWLNEGYATYLTAVCHEYLRGKEDFKFQMRAMRNNITAKDDGSVKPSDTSQVNVLFNGRLTYRKGAWLLHMLRNELGDSLFFEGCRTFLTGGDRAFAFSTTN
jgi:aminopeptidase N